MLKPLKWTFATIAAWMVVTGAQAATYQLPEAGRPAILVDAPDGWTPSRPPSVLNLITPARNGLVSLGLEEVPVGATIAAFRDNVAKAANCTLQERAEIVRLAGRTADAYYCQPSQKELATTRIVLLRIDPTHILSVSHTYRLDATGAVVQDVESVIATVRLAP